jgi:hypothetical protein
MDKLEQRLRREAADIGARAPAATVRRAQAAVHAEQARDARQQRPLRPPWWLAGLVAAGVTAVVLVAIRPDTLPREAAPTLSATPESARSLALPLDVAPLPIMQLDTVARTAPLDTELTRLQADLERARESISDDIRTMF